MTTIHKTLDFDKFHFIETNRDIVKMEELTESIKKKNLLHSKPIIVNSSYYIVDGQHRFLCAKQLNTPIYYIIDPFIEEDDIPRLQVQRPWDNDDFLNFYKNKNEDYQFIFHLKEKYKLPTNVLYTFCTGDHSFVSFRKGKMKIKHPKELLETKIREFKEIYNLLISILLKKSIKTSGLRALWKVINIEEYDHEHFIKKINLRISEVQLAFKFFLVNEIYERLCNRVYYFGSRDRSKFNSDIAI